MSPSRSRLDRLTRRSPRPGFSQGAGLLAWASLVALAAAGCKGEAAFGPRDGGPSGLGGAGFTGGSGGAATGGKGAGGMAGHGGIVGTGGVGVGGNKGSGGMAGGATGQSGGTGGQPAGGFGDRCQSNADCPQNSCKHGVCCNVDCAGICQTCDSSGNSCTSVMTGQDPRVDCPDRGAASCDSNGTGCNGAGACNLYATNTVCDAAPMCSGTGAMIPKSVCNGLGRCNPSSPVSCNGFLCQSNACLKTCADGTACVTGGFCGAGTCVGPNPNLAGNGDFEYGTTDGWSTIPNGAGLSLSTVFNGGAHAAQQMARSTFYVGPGYYIPTGLGKYNVSLWAMQNQVTSGTLPNGLLQLRLICAQGTPYYIGNVEQSMPSGVWVNLTMTVDTSLDPIVASDCFANGKVTGGVPGLVSSA